MQSSPSQLKNSRRVSFQEPLDRSIRQSSPRQPLARRSSPRQPSIRRSSPRQPLSIRRSSPRQPLSIRRSSPRQGNNKVKIQQSSHLMFEFEATGYNLSDIKRLLDQNNIPYQATENSIHVDLENPEPRQVQIINQLIDQAWDVKAALGPLQQQLQQLLLYKSFRHVTIDYKLIYLIIY